MAKLGHGCDEYLLQHDKLEEDLFFLGLMQNSRCRVQLWLHSDHGNPLLHLQTHYMVGIWVTTSAQGERANSFAPACVGWSRIR